MNAAITLTQTQLSDFLLNVALVRPVFIWGPPGIGKSSLVQQFAAQVGLPCVSLLGSQLAPEDLIGVPQIVDGTSRFCPPSMIARRDAYCLFLDELNACTHEVQKAFYSLIQERRIGEYFLPSGSIVIGAGNRAQDSAIVKPMSSALLNRMVHVHLTVSHRDWLAWAHSNGIHALVIEYIQTRPDHLWSQPPKHEEPFSTPRSWHMLSDALHGYSNQITDTCLEVLAFGCLSPHHAGQFKAFVKQIHSKYRLAAIVKGDIGWPYNPEDRDVLYFLSQSLRAQLIKELPTARTALADGPKALVHRAKALIKDLASISRRWPRCWYPGREEMTGCRTGLWSRSCAMYRGWLRKKMARKPGKHHRVMVDIATEHFNRGLAILRQHPLFAPLLLHAHVIRHERNVCPDEGWAIVTSHGDIHVHPTRRGAPDVWVHVLAHCLLHLGFGHFQANKRAREWNTACDCVILRFLADLKLGRPPQELLDAAAFSARDEERLYQELCAQGIPAHLQGFGTAGTHHNDMVEGEARWAWRSRAVDWQGYFGKGLTMAVTSAVNVAGGREPFLGADTEHVTPAHKARSWFISSYPLLGALAAAFTIVEDARICGRLSITVAAVDAESKEIFINPAAGLDEYECRFVMAHELLHVGLRHQARCLGRDPYLWNVACDYVVNGWLVEMGLGELPRLGVLYDPALKGESAEAIYDRIVTDMRRYRKLATLRGFGLGDMLERGARGVYAASDGVDLDALYRRCLSQGLMYHEEQDRGFLPAGLVEEIRALYQLPMPWDVELARWFDAYFSPLEKIHSYARPSRRQASTPDIPRPRWVPAYGAEDGRTFGVILDTSGSMDRVLLARALGAIASYSMARDVPAIRVVFCDAVTYDQGYMPPEALADRVRVQGRGGTILQPAIDLLERADDFPTNGPLLIITDGACDRLHIQREHAFLLPAGRHLPFVPKGKVFRIH